MDSANIAHTVTEAVNGLSNLGNLVVNYLNWRYMAGNFDLVLGQSGGAWSGLSY